MAFENAKLPERLDPKMVLGLLLVGITAGLTFAGDHFAFAAAPGNVGELLVGLIHMGSYYLLRDRLTANILAFIIYGAFICAGGYYLFTIYVEKVLYKMEMKKAIRDARLKKELLRDLDADDII